MWDMTDNFHVNIKLLRPDGFSAIIGGGIGGTSCAHALRQGLGSNLSLTLFEMGEVGGRLATIEMAGHEYESGGSIIHSQNREMATFVKTLGLKATKKAGRLDHWSMSTFSLFNERQEVLFQLTEWTYFQNIQMILRYGLLSLYKMSAFISELLTNFTKIYPILDAGIGFSSTAEMLKHMETRSISSASLLNATSWSLDEAMRAQGMDPLLIHEIATAAVRVNYGQLPSDLHSLVGGVALAGAEGNLWSISGGNKQVPALLLERSQAEFVSAKVDLVKLNADGSFKVEYRNRMDDNVPYLWKEGGVGESVTELEAENMDGTFDVVVLATPLTNDKKQLEFQGFPRAFEFPGRYHRCVTTFVHGRLRSKYFDTNNINLVSPSNFYEDQRPAEHGGRHLAHFHGEIARDPPTGRTHGDLLGSRSLGQILDHFLHHSGHGSIAYILIRKAERIAIIGGGIGGTSCAHALRQGLGSNLSLTLFEMGEVGGRLATIEMAGHEYESGGSIIHSQNREMATFVKTLGLKATKKAGRLDHWSMSTFSLFNERQEVLFQLTEWTYFQNIQMILRYGLLSLYKMSAFISELLTNFTKIYPILDAGIGFSSTAEMLKHMETRSISSASLLNATSWSLDEAMRAQGMDPLLIHEIATAAVRVNYGQLPSDLHSLVGGVALAGAEGNLWSISGGNKQVPALLLERSQAEFVSAKVDLVKLNADGSFKVEYRNRMDDNVPYLWKEGGVGESVTELEAENMDGTFDVVVLATPLTNDKKQLEFQGFPRAFEFPGRYHRCVTTFVHGRLRSKYFDTNNINLVSPSNFYVSLFYINAIEWAASAMEMSALGGKNVANLILKQILKKPKKHETRYDEL
ncbi:hypothetical protein TCAL_01354 [Tigriopus californicus]|uniref:Prenylcysteine lyase domain-containing protein n=1 Tax=Tigriopus californicus TaxID=6832 RepID=A0A553PCC6_TIGCA|nr:hypothetical protein TCAL_01354 [Tigriopus californicus]